LLPGGDPVLKVVKLEPLHAGGEQLDEREHEAGYAPASRRRWAGTTMCEPVGGGDVEDGGELFGGGAARAREVAAELGWRQIQVLGEVGRRSGRDQEPSKARWSGP